MSTELFENASKAAKYLKSLSNPYRLAVLCSLIEGEKNVSELQENIDISQSLLSQNLAYLKEHSFVDCRRDGKKMYYYIKDANVIRIIGLLHSMFCNINKN